MVGSRLASMVFPEPGGPESRQLCPPAAAISRALLACSCPTTSKKSMPPSGFFLEWASRLISKGVMVSSPVKWRTTSERWVGASTDGPLTMAASPPFSWATTMYSMPHFFAPKVMGRTPFVRLSVPSRASSPRNRAFLTCSGSTWPVQHRMAIAMGRSSPAPSFLRSAGARFMVIRLWGNS